MSFRHAYGDYIPPKSPTFAYITNGNMAKQQTAYVCEACGFDPPKWVGKCPSCGQWSTMKEMRLGATVGAKAAVKGRAEETRPVPIADIEAADEPRIDMGDAELNRVLGGGLVRGSLVLLGGEPGIGKSTLVLQTVLRLPGRRVLYVSGEESARQIKLRADRLCQALPSNLLILSQTSMERIYEAIDEVRPDLVVIDSIQTVALEDVESSPGSITQIRECATSLLKFAKGGGCSVVLIGHITKDGNLAGPKVLEHIVDCVLQFEGDQHHMFRILRGQKNRFGSTSELGIYEMHQSGLAPVSNPSELLLTDKREGLSGIAIACAVEGVRSLLVETQALVSSAAYGTAQRSATGFEGKRLGMLLAVLEKRVGFKLTQKDVFLNIAGGLRVSDTATDLAVVCAIVSSNIDEAIATDVCMCGEVGLSGEIRPVGRLEQRILEAQKLGFRRMLVPEQSLKGIDRKALDIELVTVGRVSEAVRELFG